MLINAILVPGDEAELDVAVDFGVAAEGGAVVHFNEPRLHLVVDKHVEPQDLKALATCARSVGHRSVRLRQSRLGRNQRLHHQSFDRSPQFHGIVPL